MLEKIWLLAETVATSSESQPTTNNHNK